MEITAGNIILMFLIAFFAYMHSFFGSTMWNRPIVVGPLVGLALGDVEAGLKLGATLELVFMGAFPVGASNPPDFVSGTIIATAYVIMSGQSISSAVLLAVPIATLVLLIDNLQMTFLLTHASHKADKYAQEGNIKGVERTQIIYSILNKVILALVVAVGFALGVPAIEKILSFVPAFITHGLDIAAGIIPAIGFAMLAKMMLTKNMVPFLLLGFLLTAYLNVTVVGVALFGIVAVMLMMSVSKNKTQQEDFVDDNEF
ncbi:PTS mannose/fructose/sorbose/N-acetylgalactosamine transporter subunit IIC [Carnobacterium maltaromaticum]|jgi:fructoselysine and glucoselysine-specific PTS system IIC component|uniref:PTS sugar transporter subunit IIC n=1 Tax=Carnobacterium maltaromaticum TaxID=2751 RepID=A0AAW9JNC5_CARML|nr:PTS sugar transporter subunit IIC [Carnobacterium maltaromaticum]KRN73822.1 PTS family mannose fructose sorbose porter component IIC [Carnobacterium maltaromaticum]MBC9808289.1 PTS sugar transporter [Carnobacterium maltaromaticum]MDZ5757088.1 PTS sugar transporter subunit IIC [Carnobacterium maltaromaticum]CRH19362.1 PTS system sorbose-specific iic component family protein [Carnobacterium maltaromaticum]CRH22225.1 PTS system sorbose-specific iic component family protein [Carnobacterium malt